MKNKLYIMSGCPCSGKTTMAKERFPNAKYVSRDEIRFSMVPEGDEYFSREDEVFEKFVKEINDGLRQSLDVVADATHLNTASRLKLLYSLDLDRSKTLVELICLRPPLEVCLERNETRKGTRSYVPINVIKKMYYSFSMPSFDDPCHFNAIERWE